MIVEPPQKDLIRGQSQQIFNNLPFFAESVQFEVKIDMDLAE